MAKCDTRVGCKDPDRTCLHVSHGVELNDGSVLQANGSDNEGYCLAYDKTDVANKCSPKYGVAVPTVTRSGHLRTSCRCYWPSLFDQEDIYSDCSVVRACDGTGNLVHYETRVPLDDMPHDAVIDIHDFECASCGTSNCTRPGRDPHTGLPSCVPTPVADRTDGLCLYESLTSGEHGTTDTAGVKAAGPASAAGKQTTTTTAPVLTVNGPFVSVDFAKAFPNSSVDKAYVPNPCAFDAFRGVSMRNECRLTLTPSGTGYCEPLSETVSTVIFDDDYLPGNGGRYANACYKFTASDKNIDAYIVEYFVRARADNDGAHNAVGVRTQPPPLPVVSLEIEFGKLDPDILDILQIPTTTDPTRKILITQSAVPEDVETIPVPFDMVTMSKFVTEHNDFVYFIPAKFAMFEYWVPVQTLKIPYCDKINSERETTGFSLKSIEKNEYELKRQQHVVACREPSYDRRLAIVPNLDVNPLGPAYNADPTSAVLRFGKADLVVRPYWYRFYCNNSQEIKAYVSRLPSRVSPDPVQPY